MIAEDSALGLLKDFPCAENFSPFRKNYINFYLVRKHLQAADGILSFHEAMVLLDSVLLNRHTPDWMREEANQLSGSLQG